MCTTRKYLVSAILGATLIVPSAVWSRTIALPLPPDVEPPIYPAPAVGYTYRWVPPVYRTVYDRVWVEQTTSRALEWVEIAPGRWAQRWVTVTVPAHWETVAQEVLVSAGHWELVRIEPPVYYPPRPVPHPTVSPGTVGVEGYSRQGGEDLGKFSPLSEWPEKK